MPQTADDLIHALNLQPHVEGGYYAPSFVSDAAFDDRRALWTSIYFLLKCGEVSHFHRLTADEMWYFQGGQSMTISMIHPDGRLEEVQLGMDLAAGERPQVLVPRGTIFGSAMNNPGYSLVGCMVSPGFTFGDFELFEREDLLARYPQHRAIIEKLTR
ncbi:cupin domain-containing protein [Ferrimonas sediminicola]|uniref:Cupin domain-containing protein n=1 Tax=Ferrimonas sediminicola TaxID=2569538 RepID=A0A4U1BI61_9GAMM|nr:cupin domain-containing protein [Ferrimonas sediminicola]TKB51009.1 cupin domain-containing protein [Ferrimonas sediminicola]